MVKSREHVLDDWEIELMLNSPMNFEEKICYHLLFFSGMRIGEAIHLKKSWIKNGKVIKIPEKQECNCSYCKRQFNKKKKRYLLAKKKFLNLKNPTEKEIKSFEKRESDWLKIKDLQGYWLPKTDKAIRPIPIRKELNEILKDIFTKTNSVMNIIKTPSTWRAIIQNHYEKYLKDKLEHYICPHILRATYASLLASTDYTSAELKAEMGWANISVADEYLRLHSISTKANDVKFRGR